MFELGLLFPRSTWTSTNWWLPIVVPLPWVWHRNAVHRVWCPRLVCRAPNQPPTTLRFSFVCRLSLIWPMSIQSHWVDGVFWPRKHLLLYRLLILVDWFWLWSVVAFVFESQHVVLPFSFCLWVFYFYENETKPTRGNSLPILPMYVHWCRSATPAMLLQKALKNLDEVYHDTKQNRSL